MLFPVLLVLTCFHWIHGYPSGAPVGTCGTMFPGHSTPEQSTAAPFTIQLSSNTYKEGTNVTITISTSTSSMQGLLVQVRKANDSSTEPVGTFTAGTAQTKLLACGSGNNNALTHSERLGQKTSLVFTWEAPSSNAGTLQVRATIVQEKTIFWTGVTSEELKYTGSSNNAPLSSSFSKILLSLILMPLILMWTR